MAQNYICWRASPDWLSFDIESSRDFCRRVGLDENTVVDFVSIWDRVLHVSFREFRATLKDIAFENFRSVANAKLISHIDLKDIPLNASDSIAFTDDDDWYAPNLFEVPANDHGARWASVRLGASFDPGQQHVATANLLTLRSVDQVIYTNNYIVTGQVIANAGLEAVLEHWSAQGAQDKGVYRPLGSDGYWSCANKNPASALSARSYLANELFRRDPLREFQRYAAALKSLHVPDAAKWLGAPLERFRKLINETIR